jgi:hypothetical protein
VPPVASTPKPSSTNSFAVGRMRSLSLSLTEMNTAPDFGSSAPAPSCALANATA